MNSTTPDLHNAGSPPDFNFDPLKSFMLATLGGGLVYLSFFRGANKQHALEAERTDAFNAAATALSKPQDISFPEIQPMGALPGAPPKFRPYNKPQSYQPSTVEDLILIDMYYRPRLSLRRHLLLTHPSETYGSIPAATPAVSELYTYIISHHLPSRFPRHFSKSPSGTLVQNHTNTNTYPIIAQSATNALRGLAENLDDDFILLLPTASGEWTVGAFVTCFPNSFTLSTKLGYTHAVQAPSDLAALPAGVSHSVKRLAWSVVKTPELFTPGAGNSIFDEDTEEETEEREVNPAKCCLRVERQTLWKLPATGAVVVGIKTYLTTMQEIHDEGEGLGLADAVEREAGAAGRPLGVWGEAVVNFLRN
ncbi:hypothetical protein EDC01DRAFT_163135 [Geopyxis carbonaria]|nr:hypothetical protein EDC01DRAFT_163135 [Geopyxis carbonaria]